MAGVGIAGGEIAAEGTPSNLSKIVDLGLFPQIQYHITLRLTNFYYSPCGCSLLTKMLFTMKWIVWMIVCFISFASPPWLIEFPLDIHALKEMTLLLPLYPEVSQRSSYPSKENA